MQLGPYLKERDISFADFATRIGAANAGVVHKYVNGKRYPRRRFLLAIARETEGEVTANDFVCAVD